MIRTVRVGPPAIETLMVSPSTTSTTWAPVCAGWLLALGDGATEGDGLGFGLVLATAAVDGDGDAWLPRSRLRN
ncbi:hypothetical protein [Nitrolancea hollandica]|uniref:hypothetical protein n=1 Tax=Nitrolancea hollandica TaxID=1206749 RepID=UPI0019309418|nr:hypothetical protein [Nitrolancea hollandica]